MDRRLYIGASDVGDILQLPNAYRTPYQVYLEKTGQSIAAPQTLPMKLGNMLEPTIAILFKEEYDKEYGTKLDELERLVDVTYYHKDYAFLVAHPDYRMDETTLVECKAITPFKLKDYSDGEIPPIFYAQCLEQMECMPEIQQVFLAVLFGNISFQIFKVERDDEIQRNIVKILVKFWNDNVVKRIPPDITDDGEVLKILYPKAVPKTRIAIDNKYEDLIEKRVQYKSEIKILNQEVEQIENILKSEIKDNEIGSTKNFEISWKNVKRKGYVVQPTMYRKFNIKQVKNVSESDYTLELE
jgi:predicted phage-related endonuclease